MNVLPMADGEILSVSHVSHMLHGGDSQLLWNGRQTSSQQPSLCSSETCYRALFRFNVNFEKARVCLLA